MKFSRKRIFFTLFALLIIFVVVPTALAHPLGNFTISRYAHLNLQDDAVNIFYVVDMAEIPTFQERQQMDTNGDGTVNKAEQEAYLSSQIPFLAENLSLVVNDTVLSITPESWQMSFLPGQGELPTMRLELTAAAVLPEKDTVWQLEYADNNYAGRLGWQETVVTAVDTLSIIESTAPSQDISDQLRTYPEDLLPAPLALNQAAVRFAPVTLANSMTNQSNAVSVVETAVVSEANRFSQDEFANLLTTTLDKPGAIVIAMLVALGLGAAHALTPGHGKTIVGAYLVGSRGTPKHALFLGLTTTITHTAGVFAFGLLVLFASRYILPELLYPWLGVLSGLLVVIIGFSLFRGHLSSWLHRNQPKKESEEEGVHTHFGISHSHVPKQQMSWRNLLALGVSGGLLPCPSALILLLSAVALQKVGFGLLLIVFFSVGLAGVLTGIGLAMVYAGKLFSKLPTQQTGLLRLLPAGSALFITIAGIGITLKALLDTGIL